MSYFHEKLLAFKMVINPYAWKKNSSRTGSISRDAIWLEPQNLLPGWVKSLLRVSREIIQNYTHIFLQAKCAADATNHWK